MHIDRKQVSSCLESGLDGRMGYKWAQENLGGENVILVWE